MTSKFKIRKGGNGGKRSVRGRIFATILSLALLALIIPTQALAAKDIKVEKMNILVEPEYDDPRVLVVMEPILSEDTELPQKVEYLLSKKMPDITVGMACEIPEGQGHRCKVYDTKEAGDFEELTYSVDSARTLFFEYYYDPFSGQKEAEDGKKSFVYEYKASYPIGNLEIQVQEPLKATDYKIEPASENISEDQQGFKYHTFSFADVKAGDVLAFNVDYTKTDKEPSIQKTTQPVNNEQVGSGESQSTNPSSTRWIVFLVVLMMVGGGWAMYWRSQTIASAEVAAERKVRPKPKKGGKGKVAAKAKTKAAKYCSNCGSEADGNSKFCSDCGSEIG